MVVFYLHLKEIESASLYHSIFASSDDCLSGNQPANHPAVGHQLSKYECDKIVNENISLATQHKLDGNKRFNEAQWNEAHELYLTALKILEPSRRGVRKTRGEEGDRRTRKQGGECRKRY